MSNRNSFRVLFDKIAFVYFIWKIYLYFSIGNGQFSLKGPALLGPIGAIYNCPFFKFT